MKKEKFYCRSLLVLFMTVLAACGSDNKNGSPAPQVEQLPQVGQNTTEQTIALNQLAQQRIAQFDLDHKESEPAFEDRQVQGMCNVQTGTRRECRTEYDNRCRTEYENVCRQVEFPVCRDVPENVCRDVPDQVCRDVPDNVCHNETYPVCAPQTRRVCTTQQVCTTEDSQVCDSRGCRTVPRRVCKPVETCNNVTENVCHNETRQRCERTTRRECTNITRRECSTVNRRVCHNEYRNECSNVPRERCEQVPRQVCENVPVYGEQPCMRTERVQVGERLTLHHLAHVKIELKNPRNRAIDANDIAVANLEDGKVYLRIDGPAAAKYRIIKVSQTAQRRNDIETEIQAVFTIEVL